MASTNKSRHAYDVDAPSRVEIPDPLTGEREPVTFKAGAVVPKNEHEMACLEQLYFIGGAARPDGSRFQPEQAATPAQLEATPDSETPEE